MRTRKYSPVELVPTQMIPESDTFVGRRLSDYSDIFPTGPEIEYDSVLGNYSGGDFSEKSPLYWLYQGVRAYHSRTSAMQERNGRSEDTRKALFATTLHTHLLHAIDRGYSNLLSDEWSPRDSVTIIARYIDAKHTEAKAVYSAEIDRFTAEQALEEAGEIPVQPTKLPTTTYDNQKLVDISDLLSPEDQKEIRTAVRSQHIQDLHKRIKRLLFETHSANLINQALAKTVTAKP